MKSNKFVKKLIAMMFLGGVSITANAGSVSASNVSFITFMNGGSVYFYVNGTRTGVPTCATSQPMQFGLNGTTAAGKNQVAVLLNAYNTNKKVIIGGTNTCNLNGVVEDVSYISTSD